MLRSPRAARRLMSVYLLTSLGLGGWAAALAQQPAVPAGLVDLEKSRVYVLVKKSGLGHDHAVEGRLKKGSRIHLGQLSKAGELIFDMPTFKVDTDEARKYVSTFFPLEGVIKKEEQDKITAIMQGEKVLDSAVHPEATLVLLRAHQVSPRSAQNPVALYDLVGQLTLHGRMQPVTLTCEVVEKGDRIRLQGSCIIPQSQFGIKPYSAFLVAGVKDQLEIYGDIWIMGLKLPKPVD